MQTCFEVSTWFHRLQRLPNLTLNPMERLETMLIEFYTLKNLIGDISVPLDPSEQIKCVLTAKRKKT